MAIGGYFIEGYWWPFLLVVIVGYSIVSHWWLSYR